MTKLAIFIPTGLRPNSFCLITELISQLTSVYNDSWLTTENYIQIMLIATQIADWILQRMKMISFDSILCGDRIKVDKWTRVDGDGQFLYLKGREIGDEK